jgi:tRNA nucleotidyltransferase (CCA-adding enzyme)
MEPVPSAAPALPGVPAPIADPRITAALDAATTALLEAAVRVAGRRCEPVYLVGGAVRDALLERPVTDLDLTVVGDGPGFGVALAAALGGRVLARSQFGTVAVGIAARRLDIVTARSERYPTPGALPVVSPGTLDQDLQRRDFSVNALALGLWGPDAGAVADPCGGRADLELGRLRVLHRNSFRDDPTRILRAARYAVRLGFRIEPQTLGWLLESAAGLALVSGARLGHELVRILYEPSPGAIWALCRDWGASDAAFSGLQWDPRGVGYGLDPRALLCTMTRPLSPDQRVALVTRLQLPSEYARCLGDFNEVERRLPGLSGATPSQVWRALHGFRIGAIAAWAALLEGTEAGLALGGYCDRLRHVRPEFRGDAVARLTGLGGPALGACLAALRDVVLDGGAPTRADQAAFVTRFAANTSRPITTIQED